MATLDADRLDFREDIYKLNSLAQLGLRAAGIAHELNNPLCAIVQFAESAARIAAAGKEPPASVFENIKNEALRCGTLVRDVLQLARPESQGPPQADLREGIMSTVRLARACSQKNCVILELDLEENLPIVAVSPGQLIQIGLNLLTNAMEAAGQNGKVTVRAYRGDDREVAWEVADNGPGIAPAIRDRLFEPFYSTKSPDSKRSGLGLGLALVREIVQQSGGSILAESPAGGGAVFTVRLPIASETP